MKKIGLQDIVLSFIEGSLAPYFWISGGTLIFLAYKSAKVFGTFMFGTFFINVFIYLLGLFLGFYLLFFLKDVREKLTIIAANSEKNSTEKGTNS